VLADQFLIISLGGVGHFIARQAKRNETNKNKNKNKKTPFDLRSLDLNSGSITVPPIFRSQQASKMYSSSKSTQVNKWNFPWGPPLLVCHAKQKQD